MVWPLSCLHAMHAFTIMIIYSYIPIFLRCLVLLLPIKHRKDKQNSLILLTHIFTPHSPTHTFSHTYTHIHTNSHTLTHTQTNSHILTHIATHSHTHTHTYTHTLNHTVLFLSYTMPVFVMYEWILS